MFIRYAYSPSFEEGWAVSVELVPRVTLDADEVNFEQGRFSTKRLRIDAYVRSKDLEKLFSENDSHVELESDQIELVFNTVLSMKLAPANHPWATLDGALSSLTIESSDCLLAVEWNTKYPENWSGLNGVHCLLEKLFASHHKTGR